MRLSGSLFLLLFVLASCASRIPTSSDQILILEPPPAKKVIIIDAGHGGKDPGTNSVKDNYEEKQLTLATARQIRKCLQDLGYEVVLTRTQDIFLPLKARSEMANSIRADLFVSIHYNYSKNAKAKGIEVFYFKEDSSSSRVIQSRLLGEAVLERLIHHTGAESRGVKAENHAVTRETLMPAILIEGGFLSNPSERQKLQDARYLRCLSWGIARGIDHYFEKSKKK